MFKTMQYVVSPSKVKKIRKDLPILMASGAEDPIGEFGKTVKAAFTLYQKAGVKDLEMHLFDKDRHEILNELDKTDVYEYIFEWIKERLLHN